MAAIPGSVPVAGFIAPTDSLDTYPATDPIWGIDGYRSVADHTERNAISDERRRYGMLVFTQDDGNVWELNAGPWAGDDTDWTAFSPGGGSGSPSAPDKSVQTNQSGSFYGEDAFTYYPESSPGAGDSFLWLTGDAEVDGGLYVDGDIYNNGELTQNGTSEFNDVATFTDDVHVTSGEVTIDTSLLLPTTATVNGISLGSQGRYANYFTPDTSNVLAGLGALEYTVNGTNNTGIGSLALYTLGYSTPGANAIAGVSYKIRVAGSTDFTTVGAANSNVGTVFTATGVWAGTGEAYPNNPHNNIGIGYQAGLAFASGNYNIIIGSNLGGFVTGNNNVIIGGYDGDLSMSNNIILSLGNASDPTGVKARWNGSSWTLKGNVVLDDGYIQLPEFGRVKLGDNGAVLSKAFDLSNSRYSGNTIFGTAGENLLAGQAVYLKASDGKWWKTNTATEAISGPVMIAICGVGASANDTDLVLLLNGFIRVDATFPTWTIGARVYLNGTAAMATSAPGSGTNRVVGYGVTGDVLYWNPAINYTFV